MGFVIPYQAFFFSFFFNIFLQGWKWQNIHTVAVAFFAVSLIGVVVVISLEHFLQYRPMMKELEKMLS